MESCCSVCECVFPVHSYRNLATEHETLMQKYLHLIQIVETEKTVAKQLRQQIEDGEIEIERLKSEVIFIMIISASVGDCYVFAILNRKWIGACVGSRATTVQLNVSQEHRSRFLGFCHLSELKWIRAVLVVSLYLSYLIIREIERDWERLGEEKWERHSVTKRCVQTHRAPLCISTHK